MNIAQQEFCSMLKTKLYDGLQGGENSKEKYIIQLLNLLLIEVQLL